MPELVYVLCALASLFCAILLIRGYLRTRERLLLWGSWCFAFFTLGNIVLVLDLAILPDGRDLTLLRVLPNLLGVAIMLAGLIWESR
jgi:hypothetical protein